MPGTTLAGAHGSGEHGRMRYEYSVTSLSWIPSEAVGGSIRLAFDAGFIRYDEPAPDEPDDLEALRAAAWRM
jgi:hypothetical protein